MTTETVNKCRVITGQKSPLSPLLGDTTEQYKFYSVANNSPKHNTDNQH